MPHNRTRPTIRQLRIEFLEQRDVPAGMHFPALASQIHGVRVAAPTLTASMSDWLFAHTWRSGRGSAFTTGGSEQIVIKRNASKVVLDWKVMFESYVMIEQHP